MSTTAPNGASDTWNGAPRARPSSETRPIVKRIRLYNPWGRFAMLPVDAVLASASRSTVASGWW